MTRLAQLVLQPTLTQRQAATRFQGKRLGVDSYDTVVKRSTLGLCDGEVKFLFLRKAAAPPQAQREGYLFLHTLPFRAVRSTFRRTALRGSRGGELVMGWFNSARFGGVHRAAPTWLSPALYSFVLVPLLTNFGYVMRKHLPDHWATQALTARHNGMRLLGAGEVLTGAEQLSLIGLPPPNHRRGIPMPLFSTVTINKDALFCSHADAKNEPGLACITTFGRFKGGMLCFPRLRVAFDIQPGDLLIADTNREQHGSIAPLRGARISVVAYLRRMPSHRSTVNRGRSSR